MESNLECLRRVFENEVAHDVRRRIRDLWGRFRSGRKKFIEIGDHKFSPIDAHLI